MSSPSQGPVGVFPPSPKAETSKQTKWLVLALMVLCGTPIAVLLWIHQYYYRVFQVTTSSMQPTLRLGDHVWTSMHYFASHTPVQGEIVLIIRPQGIMIFKRVVALPGDSIEGRKGQIYLNGKILSEPYAEYTGSRYTLDFLNNFGPIKVGPGQYFVMGDNRDNSLDSRHPDFGLVPITAIIGKPLYIIASQKGFHRWERIQ